MGETLALPAAGAVPSGAPWCRAMSTCCLLEQGLLNIWLSQMSISEQLGLPLRYGLTCCENRVSSFAGMATLNKTGMNTVARHTVVIPAQSSCSSGLHLLAYTGERGKWTAWLVGRAMCTFQKVLRLMEVLLPVLPTSVITQPLPSPSCCIGASSFSWRREAQCNPTASARTSESSQEPLRCSKHI